MLALEATRRRGERKTSSTERETPRGEETNRGRKKCQRGGSLVSGRVVSSLCSFFQFLHRTLDITHGDLVEANNLAQALTLENLDYKVSDSLPFGSPSSVFLLPIAERLGENEARILRQDGRSLPTRRRSEETSSIFHPLFPSLVSSQVANWEQMYRQWMATMERRVDNLQVTDGDFQVGDHDERGGSLDIRHSRRGCTMTTNEVLIVVQMMPTIEIHVDRSPRHSHQTVCLYSLAERIHLLL